MEAILTVKRNFAKRDLCGLLAVLAVLSSCADPTRSDPYVELELEVERLEASLSESEAVLVSLAEELQVAGDEAADASEASEALEDTLAELEIDISNLQGEAAELEASIEAESRRLGVSQDELASLKSLLAELSEVYG